MLTNLMSSFELDVALLSPLRSKNGVPCAFSVTQRGNGACEQFNANIQETHCYALCRKMPFTALRANTPECGLVFMTNIGTTMTFDCCACRLMCENKNSCIFMKLSWHLSEGGSIRRYSKYLACHYKHKQRVRCMVLWFWFSVIPPLPY